MVFLKFLIRWFITAAALGAAVFFTPGISVSDGNAVVVVLLTALIFGFVNAIIRPILTLLSCGCIVATLGLFMFVINALMLWLAASLAQAFGIGFKVESFWAALLGSIIVSIVSFLLSLFLPDTDEEIAAMRNRVGQ